MDGPVQQARRDHERGAGPAVNAEPPDPGLDEFLPDEPRGLLTRTELVGDLRPALRLVLAVVAAGVLLGAGWALVAPGQVTVTTASGASSPLSSEADHVFDATALFFLLAAAYGVIVGALAWRRRERRGPVALAAVAIGATAGALLASVVGPLLAGSLTGASPTAVLLDRAAASGGTPGPPIPASLVTTPATLGSTWTVTAAGVAAVLTYLIAAIVLGTDDLGRPEPG